MAAAALRRSSWVLEIRSSPRVLAHGQSASYARSRHGNNTVVFDRSCRRGVACSDTQLGRRACHRVRSTADPCSGQSFHLSRPDRKKRTRGYEVSGNASELAISAIRLFSPPNPSPAVFWWLFYFFYIFFPNVPARQSTVIAINVILFEDGFPPRHPRDGIKRECSSTNGRIRALENTRTHALRIMWPDFARCNHRKTIVSIAAVAILFSTAGEIHVSIVSTIIEIPISETCANLSRTTPESQNDDERQKFEINTKTETYFPPTEITLCVRKKKNLIEIPLKLLRYIRYI